MRGPGKLSLIMPLCVLAACVEVKPEQSVTAAQPDSCNAAQYAGLTGQPRAALDAMSLPAGARVIGPTDAVTMDFRPERLNFEIDPKGRVARIGCY